MRTNEIFVLHDANSLLEPLVKLKEDSKECKLDIFTKSDYKEIANNKRL